jgi:predicted MFS family arabinose efflux permease
VKSRQSAGWYVLGLLALANFLHYGNRNVVVTMYDDLRAHFDFSNSELGLLTSAFMVTHAPATVFFGWLSDRVDRKRVLALGLFVWSVAALGCALVEGIGSMLVARAIVGLGTAACVPVANALICDFVPAAKKARAVSVFNLGLFLGGACGTVLGSMMGFPSAFVLLGAPGIAIALLIAGLRLEGKAEAEEAEEVAASKYGEVSGDEVGGLLSIPTYRWTLLGALLMAFAAGGYLAWFFDFLQQSKGASESEALRIFGVSLVTGLLGVLAGGLVGDRLMRKYAFGRQAAVALGMGLSVPIALIVIYLPLGWPFYIGSWLLMFTISWYHGPLAASVDDLVPSERAGLAQGLYIAAMHLGGTAPASWLVGRVAEDTGLQTALLIPTAAMALASLAFLACLRGVSKDLVVQD